MSDDDPFSYFDSDSEDDNGTTTITTTTTTDANTTTTKQTLREPSCGVLTFHRNTEISLLHHVLNTSCCVSKNTSPEDILKIIDDYCLSRHWMMHIGPQKKQFLLSALQSSLNSSLLSNDNSTTHCYSAVEMGTYCGYSAIVMGHYLQQASLRDNNNPENSKCQYHLYSFEKQIEFAEVAIKLIDLAGLSDFVTVITTGDTDNENVALLLRDKHQLNQVQFLFLDHDKERYVHDLISFEESYLLQKGSVVVADNVVFCEIDEYRRYIKGREDEGVVSRTTIDCFVEYADDENEDMKDAIEVTTYLCDPPSHSEN